MREPLAIWIAIGVLTLGIFITYARFPVDEFYHVSRGGLAGGAGRALVFLNFSTSFVAIALIAVALSRLLCAQAVQSRRARRAVSGVAVLAVALCLVTAFVVDQGDLDVRPANAIPAVGVLLALGLTVAAVRLGGTGTARPWSAVDTIGLVAALVLIALGLPWILADFGVFIGDVPGIGGWFMSKEINDGETLSAVHLGHHHGLDGVLLAVSALALIRVLPALRQIWLRGALAVYLGVMIAYGVALAWQDFWGEQLVKRGTVEDGIPSLILPKFSADWGAILFVAVAVGIILIVATRPVRRRHVATE
jgi:hypothetical protein